MSTILLVEDDNILRDMYMKALEPTYAVIHAQTGHEALESARHNAPALILLDIMLPGGMNGFDVLRELKSSENLKQIPVIMLTNLDSEKQDALASGAAAYIVKSSIDIHDLPSVIRQYLPASLKNQS